MKKILFASTALVASTSFAMADVDLSGFAEMGIFGGDEIDTQFHTDIDVEFSMAGETDSGLTFGASVDLDEQIGDNNEDGCSVVSTGTDIDGNPVTITSTCVGGESGATRDDADDGGATIFVSGAFGTLTMGDTDGAFDFAMTEAIIGASLRDDNEHAGYNGNAGFDGFYDGQVARYDYAFTDFAVAISAEVADNRDEDDVEDAVDDAVLGIGGTYNGTFGAMTIGAGIGYQHVGDNDLYGVSLSANMDNGFQGILNYSKRDGEGGETGTNDFDHYGIAVGYEFGAFLVAANYGKYDYNDDTDQSGYALIGNYDLGGGAALQGGISNNSPRDEDSDDYTTFSLGIALSF